LDNTTLPRVKQTSAMLVALDATLQESVTTLLAVLGLRVFKVGHAVAACERIPVVMPKLVIASTAIKETDGEALNDRAIAVGAELLWLAPDGEEQKTNEIVRDAALAALDKRRV
jgi:hypothetical protein